MLFTSSDKADSAHLRTALAVAVLFHLILAVFLPNLPSFKIPKINHDSGINVFLKKTKNAEPFAQSLHHQLISPNQEQRLLEPTLDAASTSPGEHSLITEEAPQTSSQPTDVAEENVTKNGSNASIEGMIRFDRATIKAFAQQEAIRYIANNKDELKRFKYSFNSYRSYPRRAKTKSYKNRYGDYYVRASSSAGDICFVQKQEPKTDDFSTNTVYFYRCGSKPKGLELAPKG